MSDTRGTVTRGGVELLSEHLLIATGPVDHGAWNYRPLLGWLQRQRFRLIAGLMGDRRFGDLLEIGYGSGLFAPELMRRCDRYFGIDIHEMSDEVEQVLDSVGLAADLHSASASAMPLEDDSVDCIVAVSVLEFLDDLEAACEEMVRVLRPNGSIFVTVTGDSPVLDVGLRLMTGESAQADFADRRSSVEAAIRRNFAIDRAVSFPSFGVKMYRALCLSPPAT